MAKKKSPVKPILTIKGHPPEREWIEKLMHMAGDPSMVDMIRRLLVKEAKRLKHPDPPPFEDKGNWGGRRKD